LSQKSFLQFLLAGKNPLKKHNNLMHYFDVIEVTRQVTYMKWANMTIILTIIMFTYQSLDPQFRYIGPYLKQPFTVLCALTYLEGTRSPKWIHNSYGWVFFIAGMCDQADEQSELRTHSSDWPPTTFKMYVEIMLNLCKNNGIMKYAFSARLVLSE